MTSEPAPAKPAAPLPQPSSSMSAVTERLLLRGQGRADARMAGRMAALRGGDLNGPATHASGGAYPSTTPSESGFKRRARPRGSTVPRRPSGALGQRGPLGPAPLRFGPLTAHGERAGLRGRPLSVASCPQGSWERPQPHARTTTMLTP